MLTEIRGEVPTNTTPKLGNTVHTGISAETLSQKIDRAVADYHAASDPQQATQVIDRILELSRIGRISITV